MQQQDQVSLIEKHMSASPEHEFEHSLIETIYEASPDGILVVDDYATIVSHNQKLLEIFGVTSENLLKNPDQESLKGRPDNPLLLRALELVKDREGFLLRVQELYDHPDLMDVSDVELRDGRTLLRHSKALWSSKRRYLGRAWFFRDITEHKQLEHFLKEMSYRDPLTGVANRRYFFERLSEETSRARRFKSELSCVLLDIDNFKLINDQWGHATGDRVLKHLCECAKEVLRQADLFGRIGGEEFAILLPNTGFQGAFELAERLRLYVAARAVTAGSFVLGYTFSAGVATLMSGDVSGEVTLARADNALFAAKRAGRNCVEVDGEC